MANLLLITPGLDPNSEVKHHYITKEEDQNDSTTQLDDNQCDEIIKHMNSIERSTQRVYMSSQIIQMARRRSLLTHMNKKYGKQQYLLSKMQNRLTLSTTATKSTIKSIELKNENEQTQPTNENKEIKEEKIELTGKQMMDEIQKQEGVLKDKVYLMNQYFSGMNQKKLSKMYEKIETTLDEGLVQIVEYSDADNKWKQKRIRLQSNFLTVMSINNQHKEVMYLNNPKIEKDGTMIILNSIIKIKFSTISICETWEKTLKELSIFVENIPRTVINQESGLQSIGDDHHSRTHSNENSKPMSSLLTINI